MIITEELIDKETKSERVGEQISFTIEVNETPIEKEKKSKTKRAKTAKPKADKIKILFVCTGNTCRSAMAQAIFEHYIKSQKLGARFSVHSSGLSAVEGDGMTPSAKAGLAYIDIPVPKHIAKRFNADECEKSTLTVCMTARQKMAINSPKAYSIGEITRRGDVPDPFGYAIEEYVKVAKYLRQSIGEVLAFAENLAKANKPSKIS